MLRSTLRKVKSHTMMGLILEGFFVFCVITFHLTTVELVLRSHHVVYRSFLYAPKRFQTEHPYI